MIVNNLKKVQNIFGLKCCMQDLNVWYSVVELLDVYPFLDKKSDRMILI